MNRLKMLIALKLKGFVDYWNTQAIRERFDASVAILDGTIIYPNVSLGRYTYVGSNGLIASGKIGAFSSIANNVVIGVDDHSIEAVSTHPFWSAPNGWTFSTVDDVERWTQSKPEPEIGNDVWIGANVVIVRGSVIEDGAVIGAGAVVTGRVPAYAIAVGVPAKVIRYRFDPETCEKLRKLKWWDWERERIDRARHEFGDVQNFLEHYA